MKLFLVHAGFYDKNVSDGFYESHTNYFIVEESVKEAKKKADAEAKKLQGRGVAEQRAAIIEGFNFITIGFIVAGLSVEGATGGIGFVHLEALVSIVITSILFAPLGAKVTHIVDSKKLKKGFSVFLGFLGVMVVLFQ